ncbi:cytoplasmic tRNA 2-thiolation protein 2 isoform X2 [Rhodamnia argentea]|uniref:Cytoplasmic tRNA 2-thiolation protein 2 n=1 Tax=Rhodamnia argentea TaxID=178133 RepID=A0A8B8N7K5_9MYRT|nr:cytoplasmic tRNA 2-thiolation protein 2 isoform X2 [Rhodamnia argentea]
MACNGSNCQANCHRDEDERAARSDDVSSTAAVDGSGAVCVKCKANEPIPTAAISRGGEVGRFCADCFRSNLFAKFRHAVTSNAMISPADNVLVAFSGGHASRVALQFVHDMQYKAQKNFDASRDRSLPVFGVGVAFIDESTGYPITSSEMDRVLGDMKLMVSQLSPPTKELHIFPVHSVYSEGSRDSRERLKELLDRVSDATGKEDLLVHLRMLSLQKIASDNGYNRIVLGSCISRFASHVLSATVKGQGYSLPADIQYVDARWGVPLVFPLRDCLAQELSMLCHLDGLKTVELPNVPCSSINSLVSSFVALLQEENPSRECTIVRTAGKLTPFHFNRIPEINDCNVPLATRRRQKSNQPLMFLVLPAVQVVSSKYFLRIPLIWSSSVHFCPRHCFPERSKAIIMILAH